MRRKTCVAVGRIAQSEQERGCLDRQQPAGCSRDWERAVLDEARLLRAAVTAWFSPATGGRWKPSITWIEAVRP